MIRFNNRYVYIYLKVIFTSICDSKIENRLAKFYKIGTTKYLIISNLLTLHVYSVV